MRCVYAGFFDGRVTASGRDMDAVSLDKLTTLVATVQFDIILVCLDMNERRYREQDMQLFEILRRAFNGVQFLERTVVVFTRSNQIKLPGILADPAWI